jgi:hypothetical protein
MRGEQSRWSVIGEVELDRFSPFDASSEPSCARMYVVERGCGPLSNCRFTRDVTSASALEELKTNLSFLPTLGAIAAIGSCAFLPPICGFALRPDSPQVVCARALEVTTVAC